MIGSGFRGFGTQLLGNILPFFAAADRRSPLRFSPFIHCLLASKASKATALSCCDAKGSGFGLFSSLAKPLQSHSKATATVSPQRHFEYQRGRIGFVLSLVLSLVFSSVFSFVLSGVLNSITAAAGCWQPPPKKPKATAKATAAGRIGFNKRRIESVGHQVRPRSKWGFLDPD